ncbi:hypothetical protein P3T73_00995 [Kiritimatiellota bacterium B12222]|nr:hypothetical protein P3T73_00995 [Kiritimatiellota bacterium B12222]
MMNTTTDNEKRLRRIRIVAWGIALGIQTVAILIFVLNENLHKQTLWLNREENDQRVSDVRERSRNREQQQAKKREQTPLAKQDAQALQAREDQKRQTQAEKRLDRMATSYEKIKAHEKEQLEVLKQQTLQKFKNREDKNFQRLTRRLKFEAKKLDQMAKADEMSEEIQTQLKKVLESTLLAEKEAPTPDQMIEESQGRNDMQDAAKDLQAEVDTLSRKLEASEKPINEEMEKLLGRMQDDSQRFSELAEEIAALPVGSSKVAEHLAETPASVEDSALMQQLARKDQLSTDELYDTAVALEKKLTQRYENAQAATLAALRKKTFTEAKDKLATTGTSDRPELGKELRDQTVNTVGDLNKYRDTLDRTVSEMENMSARAQNRMRQVDPQHTSTAKPKASQPSPGRDIASLDMQRKQKLMSVSHQQRSKSLDLTGLMGGANSSSENGDASSGQSGQVKALPKSELSEKIVVARALPGRRFTDEALRKGWLYIDTWYIIGPWDLREYKSTVLPPETEIDLDAVYTNGKSGRIRLARSHKLIDVDGKLQWRFHQSDKLFVRPPIETGDAIYFAYTELYFDQQRDILVAIGIDDNSKVWINDQVIWSSNVNTWELGTSLRKVTFRKGYNRVLIRMENGAPLMDFSLVLCPPEALPDEG